MLLPIRPLPTKGESIQGYIVRLAEEHGRDRLSTFMHECGIKRNIRLDIRNDDLISSIVELTGHRHALIIDACHPKEIRYLGWVDNREFRDLALPNPRLCPLCIKEHPFHQTQWQYLPYTHCSTHQTPLLESCPHCLTEFQWQPHLTRGYCQTCLSSADEMASAISSGLPNYQLSLERLSSEKDRKALVYDIMLAAQRVLRPYESSFVHLERVPKGMCNWAETLSSAYDLLTEPAHAREYLLGCAYYRRNLAALGASAVFEPLFDLCAHLRCRWPLQSQLSPRTSLPDSSSLEPSFQLSHFHYSRGDLVPSTSDLRGLEKLLGCKSSDITMLVNAKVITTKHYTDLSRDFMFELAPIAEAVVRTKRMECPNARPLKELEHLLPLFHAKPGHIYGAILKGKIRSQFNQQANRVFEDISISPIGLLRFLSKHFKSLGDIEITQRHACQLLRLPNSSFQEVVNSGYLQHTPLQSESFYVADIYRFLKRYWILPRWAKAYGLPQTSIRERLISDKIQPCIGKHVYEKSQALRSAIKPFLLNK